VNRIFEGTNEINRLLIPGMLAKRAVKGELGIIPAARALQDELLGPPSMPSTDDTPFAEERRVLEALKKTALMVFGVAMQTYGTKLADQQEVLMYIADLLIDVYTVESALLRAMAAQGSSRASLHADAARVLLNDAAVRIEMTARQTLAVTVSGDTLRTMLAGLKRLSKFVPFDTVTLRRRLADAAVEQGAYIFS
jgi:hypothetical protein